MKPLYYIAAAAFISLIFFLASTSVHGNLEWVRGKYGEKCYYKGTEHKNVKHKLYFDSYESCINSITN